MRSRTFKRMCAGSSDNLTQMNWQMSSLSLHLFCRLCWSTFCKYTFILNHSIARFQYVSAFQREDNLTKKQQYKTFQFLVFVVKLLYLLFLLNKQLPFF